MVQRFQIPKGKIPKDQKHTFRMRLIGIFRKWIEYNAHIMDNEIVGLIRDFVDSLPDDSSAYGEVLTAELSKDRNSIEEELDKISIGTSTKASWRPYVSVNELDASDVAQQLTMIELLYFKDIEAKYITIFILTLVNY